MSRVEQFLLLGMAFGIWGIQLLGAPALAGGLAVLIAGMFVTIGIQIMSKS